MAGHGRTRLREDQHTLEAPELDPRDDAYAHSSESFDRIAFAAALVRHFRPPNLTVVFHESYAGVRVERGRDYARGGTWAMVGIAQTASRERIALAIAEVLGIERVPFVVDLLVQAGRQAADNASPA
jgi:hypothetical protein